MKKSLLLIMFSLFLSFNSFAQDNFSFGLKAGYSSAHLKADSFNSSKNNSSYFFGGFTEFKLTNSFSIQPELLYYKHKTSAVISNNSNRIYNYNYLKIPVLAKWYLTDQFSLEFGPSLDVFLSQSGKIQYQNPEDYNLTGVLGASYKLSEKLFLNVNYAKDLSNDLLNKRFSSLNGFSFGVGFKF